MSSVKCDYFWHMERPYAAYGVDDGKCNFFEGAILGIYNQNSFQTGPADLQSKPPFDIADKIVTCKTTRMSETV